MKKTILGLLSASLLGLAGCGEDQQYHRTHYDILDKSASVVLVERTFNVAYTTHAFGAKLVFTMYEQGTYNFIGWRQKCGKQPLQSCTEEKTESWEYDIETKDTPAARKETLRQKISRLEAIHVDAVGKIHSDSIPLQYVGKGELQYDGR